MTETIYWNGPILTMEEPLYVEALWEKDGFIAGAVSYTHLDVYKRQGYQSGIS